MAYEVGFKPSALRQLRKLDEDIQTAIVEKVEALADDPRTEGCKKLKGEQNLYRIRVLKNYRVVYQIQDKQLVATVVKVGHRPDIYRQNKQRSQFYKLPKPFFFLSLPPFFFLPPPPW
ncbi:MAG: type II toxin-antitoxin system RelE/ParE family toxin [Plectolyngbya sp. WJT66-NPBG17]|jgi:mRNA interferase RelE/StbE|nr:type II toxin-antitoxin system RelE/ParE family toxin [Plectolyngbya sp. WJT66-NPBG17]MBW4525618.1 type II toxin-antitoxin system RelE/ParE family toxin [Phormidium tanganyikae FI6-MK23]